MKKCILISVLILFCLLCAAAGASPAMTDGEATGWIADNNYLFLQTPGGMVAQLSMPIYDLVQMTDDELFCLSGNQQIIAVKKDGSGSRIVENADGDTIRNLRMRLEDGILILNEQQIASSVSAAATDGRYLYYVEKTGPSSFVLRVSDTGNDGRLIMQQSRDAYALSFSDKYVAEPVSITVTREAVTLTAKDQQITALNLLTGESTVHHAASDRTAAACVQGGMLYRYQLAEDGHWIPESGTALSTPTPMPTQTPTPTPGPTQNPQGYTDDDGTIYFGAYGSTVRKIQRRLYDLGYPISGIDGKYGEETQLAINLFCDAIHVREHRYITRRVQNKLFSKDAPVYDPYLPLKMGDEGVSVLYMQIKLKELGYDPGKLDGIYGKNTVDAVAHFQAANGMSPGPGDKEKPGECASRELLELLFNTEPGPDPGPTLTPPPTAEPTPTPAPVKPATPSDLK